MTTLTGIAAGSSGASGGTLTAAVRRALTAATEQTVSAAPAAIPSPREASDVYISKAALAAAAAKDDATKDVAALRAEVRSVLDAQRKLGAAEPDYSGMSGRAIAVVALNRDGAFSKAEQNAAKAELRDATRQEFTKATAGTSASAGLSVYSAQMIVEYDQMSDEEREARGWTPALRAGAEDFVSTTTNSNSLWDMIGD